MEKVQIDAALNEGATPKDLAMQGMTSAVAPKVLSEQMKIQRYQDDLLKWKNYLNFSIFRIL